MQIRRDSWMAIEARRAGLSVIGLLVFVVSPASGATGWGVSPPFHLDTTDPEATIEGRVLDAFNDLSISHAEVHARNLNTMDVYDTVTDDDGNFSLAVPGGAAYECEFEHDHYTTWIHETPELPPGGWFVFEGDDSAKLDTKAVILLHGIFGGADSWQSGDYDFRTRLSEAAEWGVNVLEPISLVPNDLGWLGTAGSVNAQTDRLADYLSDLDAEGMRSVHIVAHSMGGLVARQYIRNNAGKVKTLVMLGTPNHGSELATEFKHLLLWAEGKISHGLLSYVPPAGQNLIPDSDLLRDLNYGGANGNTNWGCPAHPDETTLDSTTRYYTYTGSAFQSNPFGACDLRWPLGYWLRNQTDGCSNDFIVPVSSVPLRAGTPMDNVHNWKDTDCGCLSGHLRTDCPPMTEDDCVVNLVARALAGETACTENADPPREDRDEGPAGQNVAFDYLLLPPEGSTDLPAACGTADSLVFRSSQLRGMTDLRLLDPSGRLITPDTAAVDPDIDYTELEWMQWFTVRDGASGEWRMLADATPTDSAEVVLMAAEFGGVALVIGVDDPELLPGGTQRIEATLLHEDGYLTGATVNGTVTGPDSVEVPIVLLDDGTNGDETPDDGTYTAIVSGHAGAGQYDLAVEATGFYGEGAVLNRHGGRPYFVAARPDLELSAGDIDLSFAVVDSQTVVTVTLTFRNIGQAPADTVRVRFLEQETGLAFGEAQLPTLGIGQETEVSADWVMRYGAPEYHLGGRVSVLGSPGEANILNNEAYDGLVVAGVDEDDSPGSEPPVPEDRVGVRRGLEVFPNPFGLETTLRYILPDRQRVNLTIHDVAGRQVRILAFGEEGPGVHLVVWDGLDTSGRRVAAGIYYARLWTGSGYQTGRILLVR